MSHARYHASRFALAVFVLGFALVPAGPRLGTRAEDPPAPAVSGRLETVEGVSVLHLWGSPRERGFAHGYLLAEVIVRGVEDSFFSAMGPDASIYANRVLPLIAAGFSFSPAEIEELQGLVDGIAKRLPERKVKQLGRKLDLDDAKALNTYGDWYALGCSSAAVWGSLTADGKPSVVRNFDFMTLDLVVRSQHLRVVRPAPGTREKGWVGVAVPGGIGPASAMNAEGVFVAIHDVGIAPGLKDYIQGNVPRMLAMRRLLEELPAEGAVEKAAALCRTWPTLFGNNFIVATPDSKGGLPAGILEYDSREAKEQGVTLRGPAEGKDGAEAEFIACSNGHRARGRDSCDRYDSLVRFCKESTKRPFDLEALERLAESSAVPRDGKPVKVHGTLHEVIASTGERVLWVRMLEAQGKHIKDAKCVRFELDRLLAGEATSAPVSAPVSAPAATVPASTTATPAAAPAAAPPVPAAASLETAPPSR